MRAAGVLAASMAAVALVAGCGPTDDEASVASAPTTAGPEVSEAPTPVEPVAQSPEPVAFDANPALYDASDICAVIEDHWAEFYPDYDMSDPFAIEDDALVDWTGIGCSVSAIGGNGTITVSVRTGGDEALWSSPPSFWQNVGCDEAMSVAASNPEANAAHTFACETGTGPTYLMHTSVYDDGVVNIDAYDYGDAALLFAPETVFGWVQLVTTELSRDGSSTGDGDSGAGSDGFAMESGEWDGSIHVESLANPAHGDVLSCAVGTWMLDGDELMKSAWASPDILKAFSGQVILGIDRSNVYVDVDFAWEHEQSWASGEVNWSGEFYDYTVDTSQEPYAVLEPTSHRFIRGGGQFDPEFVEVGSFGDVVIVNCDGDTLDAVNSAGRGEYRRLN